MEILTLILIIVSLLGITCYLLQIVAIKSVIKDKCNSSTKLSRDFKESKIPSTDFTPPISILKPLKGLDDNLYDNLISICNQDYPKYEIIFSVQDYNDPAFKIAQKIKERHPEKDITLLVEKCHKGLNPKVNNLISSFKIAKYEYFLISDSNVLVSKNYLREIIKPFKSSKTGLVSNLIKGSRGYSLGSIFENLHLNSFVLGNVCFLEKFLKIPCVIGKSMLMKKSDFLAIGGFNAVKDLLAEDYIIGKKMHEIGKKVVLSNYIIENINEYRGLKEFLNRHIRWSKLRWKIGGFKYISELIINPIFISSIAFIFYPTILTLIYLIFINSIKVAGDIYIGSKIKSDIKKLYFLLIPLKDIIIGITWFIPLYSNKIVWRDNKYFIGKDSRLFECNSEASFLGKFRFINYFKAKHA